MMEKAIFFLVWLLLTSSAIFLSRYAVRRSERGDPGW